MTLSDVGAYIIDLLWELWEEFREIRALINDVRAILNCVVGAPLGTDASEDDTWSNLSCSEVTEEAQSQTSGSIQGMAVSVSWLSIPLTMPHVADSDMQDVSSFPADITGDT